MASLTIRNLEENVKALLHIRAARHGNSIEEEAQQILRTVLLENVPPSENLAEIIQQRFANLDGIDDLPIVPREPMREPPQVEQ